MQVRRLEWCALGMMLIVIHCLLVPLSWSFDYESPRAGYPVIEFVTLELIAAGLYLSLLWLIPRVRADRGMLAVVVAVGLAMRIVTLTSTPILEDDFYRYFWDGAVVAGGDSPYRYSPADVLAAGAESSSAAGLSKLSVLAESSRPVAQRINYPRLTSVYPPLAQGAFALSAVIEPFSLTTWRVSLLLFECVSLVLLYLILVRLNRSPLWLALYWWNPLVVKELVNSAHMDAVLLPALVGALLLMLLGKRVLACGCLALAAGIKLWPVLLLPIAIRPLLARPRALIAACVVCLVAFSGTGWWLYAQASGDSGLRAYATGWNMNDAFFVVIHWLVENAVTVLGLDWMSSDGVTRALIAATILGLSLWLNRHVADSGDELGRRFATVTAIVFLMSPAQFPWYYTWLVPFLAVAPSPALLLLTALLPLYYLRFYLDFRGQAHLFDHGIVWLEFLPVWLLLARDWWLRARSESPTRIEPGLP